MARRFSFKKVFTGEHGKCLGCSSPTFFALYDLKDGSECPRCSECALKISKGRCTGLKRYLIHKTTRGSRTKIFEFYKGKIEESAFKTDITETPQVSGVKLPLMKQGVTK